MENRLISQHFEADHERLKNLLKQYQRLKNSDYPRAKENFAAFHYGLRRHMAWEEDVLFPLFERKTGIEWGGPTETLRADHREITVHLEAMQNTLFAGSPNTDKEEQILVSLLEIHDHIEENVLYPAMDQLVTDAENDAAFEAIRNIPDLL